MELNKKYVNFVIDNLFSGSIKVELPEQLEDGGTAHWKLGAIVEVEVTYQVVEKYSRSALFIFKFDDYVIEQQIYLSIEDGPHTIYRKFMWKVAKLVFDTYVNNGRKADIQQMYADRRAQIGAAITKAITSSEQST